MIRSSRAARQRERWHVLGGILALCAALAVAGSALWLYLGQQDSALDPQTLCPVSGPKGHAVLLVDQTDPLNFTQKQAFLGYLAEFGQGKVQEGELLSVFVLGEELSSAARPLFAMCNPGQGQDKNIWTANPERLRRQFEARFQKPMAELAERLSQAQPARTSPIMEMLQLVAINGFRAAHTAGPQRLYVVSDMLQNTAGYSQYQGIIDFAEFQASPIFPKVRADLAGVEVELAYLLNAPQRQTRRHAKFWEDYFQAMGARLVSVRPLEG
jgi:hypothetical protein